MTKHPSDRYPIPDLVLVVILGLVVWWLCPISTPVAVVLAFAAHRMDTYLTILAADTPK
jgi:hypothetical protein